MSEYYETTADKFVFKVLKTLRYSKDEVWVKPESNGSIRVGLTDFAQRRAGDLVFAEVQAPGTQVAVGGFIGSYETVKRVQDILSPVDGQITEINSLIDSKPEVINRDPCSARAEKYSLVWQSIKAKVSLGPEIKLI